MEGGWEIILSLFSFMADCRELREALGSAGNGTALRVIGSSRKYREVAEPSEVLTAIVNLQAANRELWPFDQTSDFLWQCLHNYGKPPEHGNIDNSDIDWQGFCAT